MGLIFLMSHFQVLLMRHFQGSEDLDGHVQVSQVWISHFQVSQGLDEVCLFESFSSLSSLDKSFSSLSGIG